MAENYSFRSAVNGFNRNDVISYIEALLEEKAALEIRVNALEEEIKTLNDENDTLRTVIVDESEKKETDDKCNQCEIEKVYEARLGAAMLDAKRFSEILVKEANDKASGLFADAYASADDTSLRAKKISQNVVDINKQFNAAFKALLDNMNALGASLEGFKKEVKASGAKFDYKTDFAPTPGENTEASAVKASDDQKNAGNDVNFDDADEFDFRVDLHD